MKITEELIPVEYNTRTPQYREKFRRHFDALREKFPSLSCADYASGNKARGLNKRSFQRWCSETKRKSDESAIKNQQSNEVANIQDRWGHKDVVNLTTRSDLS